jgi:hypothetical protein
MDGGTWEKRHGFRLDGLATMVYVRSARSGPYPPCHHVMVMVGIKGFG